MARKTSTPNVPEGTASDIARLVNIEHEIQSHLIGLQRAIDKLDPDDLRRRVRKELSLFVENGGFPSAGWLLGQ